MDSPIILEVVYMYGQLESFVWILVNPHCIKCLCNKEIVKYHRCGIYFSYFLVCISYICFNNVIAIRESCLFRYSAISGFTASQHPLATTLIHNCKQFNPRDHWNLIYSKHQWNFISLRVQLTLFGQLMQQFMAS